MVLPVDDGAREIIGLLSRGGYEAFIVGGCIRDVLLGISPSDWDVCTSAKPDEVCRLFENAGFNVVKTGEKHGTVTVLSGHKPYEVTTFRIDGEYYDGRRPENVSFCSNIESDLSRRDFTVNAMAYNDLRGLVDPFGGRADLEKGLVRAVGNPEKRFCEDGLRMLRAIRFSARFGFEIESGTYTAIKSCAKRIELISAERVYAELCGIINSPMPSRVSLLYDTGLMSYVLPELIPVFNRAHCKPDGGQIMNALDASAPSLEIRLALLFYYAGKCKESDRGYSGASAELAACALTRLKAPSELRSRVTLLIMFYHGKISLTPYGVKKIMCRHGCDILVDLCKMYAAGAACLSTANADKDVLFAEKLCETAGGIISRGEPYNLSMLAVNGNDARLAGLEGPEIGRSLNGLLDYVMRYPHKNTRAILLAKLNSR